MLTSTRAEDDGSSIREGDLSAKARFRVHDPTGSRRPVPGTFSVVRLQEMRMPVKKMRGR